MDIDEVPSHRDPLFVTSLLLNPEEEIVQTLRSDPKQSALFRKAIATEPNEELVAKKMVQISAKLLPADELPGWVTRFSLPLTPLSLIEIVKQGRDDLLDEYQELTPQEWLAIRTNLGDSLLHLAIEEKHFEFAKKLVKKCPTFLLATNPQGKYALDALPEDPELLPLVEALTLSYAQMDGHALSPDVTLWRQLAALCYLKEGSYWITQLLKKHPVVNVLDPREVAKQPFHYHPLKICARYGKELPGLQDMPKDNLIVFALMAGGEEYVSRFEQHMDKNSALSTQPFYVLEHPLYQKMAFALGAIHDFTTALLLEKGLDELALKRINDDPYAAVRADPNSPHTERIWTEHFANKPHQEIEALTSFIDPHFVGRSHEGFLFIVKKLRQLLNEETASTCTVIEPILYCVIAAHDRDFARQVFSIFKRNNSFKNWFALLIAARARVCKKTEVQQDWFRDLILLGEEFLPLSLGPAVLHNLIAYGEVTLLSWLRERYFQQFQEALHTKMPNDNTPFVCALSNYNLKPTSRSLEVLKFLSNDIDWKKREQIDVSWKKTINCTLRCYAFLFADAPIFECLAKEGAWEPQELKEILSLGQDLRGDFTLTAAEKLLSLFLDEASRDPHLLCRENAERLVKIVLKVKREKEGETHLKLLEPLLAQQPALMRDTFTSSSYNDFLALTAITANDCKWLKEHGVPFPSPREAEEPLLQGWIPKNLRNWWSQQMAQGITVPKGRTKFGDSEKLNFNHELFVAMTKDTWQRLSQDKRFKKASKTSFETVINSQKFLIERPVNAHFLEVTTLDGAIRRSLCRGAYTLERLLRIMEDDSLLAKKRGDLEQLKAQNLQPHFSDLPVTLDTNITMPLLLPAPVPTFTTPALLTRTPAGLDVHYYDPNDGKAKTKPFVWSLSCIEETRLFIQNHDRLLNQRFLALQEAHPNWKCLWGTQTPKDDGEYLNVQRNGQRTTACVQYLYKGELTGAGTSLPGIPSPEKALSTINEARARASFYGEMSNIVGSKVLQLVHDKVNFQARVKRLEEHAMFQGVALLSHVSLPFLILTRDLLTQRLLFMPSGPSDAVKKGHSLHQIKEQLSDGA